MYNGWSVDLVNVQKTSVKQPEQQSDRLLFRHWAMASVGPNMLICACVAHTDAKHVLGLYRVHTGSRWETPQVHGPILMCIGILGKIKSGDCGSGGDYELDRGLLWHK